MIKSIGMVLLLPLFIVVTIISPITLNRGWVRTDKNLNQYESFWKTWWKNIKEIWTDDIF